jgi:hypothetical protein
MLRQFLSQFELHRLPIVSMGIFLCIFLFVLLRVLRRGRDGYRCTASLPLDDGPITSITRTDHGHR